LEEIEEFAENFSDKIRIAINTLDNDRMVLQMIISA